MLSQLFTGSAGGPPQRAAGAKFRVTQTIHCSLRAHCGRAARAPSTPLTGSVVVSATATLDQLHILFVSLPGPYPGYEIEKMKLVFLHGAPAVGKLTVADELAKLTGFRLFHNHLTVDLVVALFPFGSEPFILLREQIWLAAFSEAARNGVSLIFTFNPERTVRESFIADAQAAVAEAGGQVIFVELTCSEAELERRMEEPSRREFGKLASVEQYRELKDAGAFNFPKLPKGMSVDTTNQTPADSAKLISEYIASM
jgi:chloramphenicol 3-O-phosphotransferase